MTVKQANSLHHEIVEQHVSIQQKKDHQVENCFKETQLDKFSRLAKEFSIICDIENTEKQFVNQLIETGYNEPELFHDFSQYALSTGQHIKGEQL